MSEGGLQGLVRCKGGGMVIQNKSSNLKKFRKKREGVLRLLPQIVKKKTKEVNSSINDLHIIQWSKEHCPQNCNYK